MVSSNANAMGIIFPNSYDSLVPELVSNRLMASIPFASRYRMIDFILSSMVNCGIDNISVLVRNNYYSLMDHLGSGREWDLARKKGGLNIIPPFAEKSVGMYNGRIDALASILAFLKSQKEKYQDASHVCHAFVIGNNAEVLGMSDAGEPSGTAGRPMLDVLKGSGITNIVLTVTRYFGGTLLGTGGLVKAYGDCAKSAIEKALEENAVEEILEKKEFSISMDYGLYETVKRKISDFKLYDISEDYSDVVLLKGKILAEQFDDFAARIKNLSGGRISIKI